MSQQQNLTLDTFVGLAVLRATGARELVVHYNGSGDSGGIEEVYAHTGEPSATVTADDEIEADALEEATFEGYEAAGERVPIDEKLKASIEAWAWAHAIPGYGWENNEGGYGTVVVNLESMTVVVRHIDRVEDSLDPATRTVPVPTGELTDTLARVLTGDVPVLELSVYSYRSAFPFTDWMIGAGDKREPALSDDEVDVLKQWADQVWTAMLPSAGASDTDFTADVRFTHSGTDPARFEAEFTLRGTVVEDGPPNISSTTL